MNNILARVRTWHVENAVVLAVLLTTWLLSGHRAVELIGTAAVFCGFCHGSISERLREREALKERPSVECHTKLIWFFVGKETAWFSYFVLMHAWSALAGCALFAAYPLWRRWWRRRHPIGPDVQVDVGDEGLDHEP